MSRTPGVLVRGGGPGCECAPPPPSPILGPSCFLQYSIKKKERISVLHVPWFRHTHGTRAFSSLFRAFKQHYILQYRLKVRECPPSPTR